MKAIVEKYLKPIEKELQSLPFHSEPATLYDPCRYVLQNGGKRIRPVLTLMGAGLFGANADNAMPAALSVELIHNFTLVHDDIMDRAESRRGKPSIHVKWNQSTAILSGDHLFVHALKELSVYLDDDRLSKQRFKQLYDTFLNAVHKVCEGQALDMEFETRESVKTEEYLQMISGKTAALISAALAMGGIVSGAGEQEVENLEKLGLNMGLAFQIQDDLLDVTADPEKFGKTRGGDIREGKKTYLMLLALERGNESDRNTLKSVLSKKHADEKDIQNVINLYEENDVISSTKEKMNDYYNASFKTLNLFGDSNYKQDLKGLLEFLKQREY